MKLPPGYVPGSGVHKASGFGGFGERLLRQQGWEKGDGLGKHKTGRAEAIQVKKKEDTSGVGANRSQITSDKWWEGAFNTALHIVNHEDSSSDSDSDSDESTADEVTVCARNSDGTITSAAKHELQIAADLAAQPAWHGGGRFGGREGKLARIRQQEALAAAKLGLALPKADLAPAAASVKSQKRKAHPSTAADESCHDEVHVAVIKTGKSKKHKDKQAAGDQQATASQQTGGTASSLHPEHPPLGKKRIVVEPAFTAIVPAVPFVPTPASGWWGAKKFKSAGVMEGMDQPQNKAQSERQQFDEDDQTNLYMAAQHLKTSGKKGLGTKSHIGKVRGAKWEGSKTTFDDGPSHDDGKTPDITAQMTDRENDADLKQCSHPPGGAASQQQLPKMKWKKMAMAELQKAESQQMKLKQLQKALMEQALAKHPQESSHKQALKAELLRSLSSSSKFWICGKAVSLAQ